jgi:hypothetical protein
MTTTPETTDTRIEKRLAELIKFRAERKDALDLPGTMTQREVNTYHAETALLDQRIATIRTAAEALASLPTDADIKWRDHLVTWRATLCDELLTIKSPIRDKDTKERADRLTFSIKLIDFGLAISSLGIVTLAPTRIGELMAAAGYEVQGPALRGPHGWRGSIKEVEHRITGTTKQRAEAQAALDVALMDDAERATADAESQAHRDALSTMNLKGNAEGTGLVAFTKDGDPLSVADMTPAQKAAFTRFEAVAYPPRQPVTG